MSTYTFLLGLILGFMFAYTWFVPHGLYIRFQNPNILDDLREASGASSNKDLITRALTIYEIIILRRARGGKTFIRYKNMDEEELKL